MYIQLQTHEEELIQVMRTHYHVTAYPPLAGLKDKSKPNKKKKLQVKSDHIGGREGRGYFYLEIVVSVVGDKVGE